MKVELEEFRTEHARMFVELAESAFTRVHKDARPRWGVSQISRILGSDNPAGPSLLAVAREQGKVLGCSAAIPAGYRTEAGARAVGHQLGFFTVDHRVQSRGIGDALIIALLNAHRDDPDAFVYAFPNPRSVNKARRLGFVDVDSVPTRIHVSPLPARATVGWRNAAWELDVLDAAAAARAADEMLPGASEAVGFLRDAACFRWRYCGPEGDALYRFVRGRSRSHGSQFLAVSGRHRFSSLSFAVMLDLLSPDPLRDYASGLAGVRKAERREGVALLYEASNHGAVARAAGRHRPSHPALRVPDRFNPRPVVLQLVVAGSPISTAEFSRNLVFAGDWFAF